MTVATAVDIYMQSPNCSAAKKAVDAAFGGGSGHIFKRRINGVCEKGPSERSLCKLHWITKCVGQFPWYLNHTYIGLSTKELDTIPADIALDIGLWRFRLGEMGSTAA